MAQRKICIVQLGLIGDMLLVTPVCRALKRADPSCELHLLAGRRNCAVAIGNPDVDYVHVHSKRFFCTIKLLVYLVTTRFDIWIDPKSHASTESAVFGRIARARMKIGFKGAGVFTHPSCDELPGGEHVAKRNLRNLMYLGIQDSRVQPVAPDVTIEEESFRRFRSDNGLDQYCVINISVSTPDRNWQTEKWVALTKAITGTGLVCVISCLYGDREKRSVIIAGASRCFAYDAPTVRDVFPLVRHCAIVVTIDTSFVHIAAAYNRPVVALFGNQKENYTRFWPLSEQHRVVMHPDTGAPVGKIEVVPVEQSFRELLGKIVKQ